jgi:hypothetical protein
MKIRIIRVPPGGAPYVIRKDCVGLVLPVCGGIEMGRGDPDDPNDNDYPVLARDAIVALRSANKEEAARFWEELFEDRQDRKPLFFAQRCCEVVEE